LSGLENSIYSESSGESSNLQEFVVAETRLTVQEPRGKERPLLEAVTRGMGKTRLTEKPKGVL
jgi:hypothetical protein